MRFALSQFAQKVAHFTIFNIQGAIACLLKK